MKQNKIKIQQIWINKNTNEVEMKRNFYYNKKTGIGCFLPKGKHNFESMEHMFETTNLNTSILNKALSMHTAMTKNAKNQYAFKLLVVNHTGRTVQIDPKPSRR